MRDTSNDTFILCYEMPDGSFKDRRDLTKTEWDRLCGFATAKSAPMILKEELAEMKELGYEVTFKPAV